MVISQGSDFRAIRCAFVNVSVECTQIVGIYNIRFNLFYIVITPGYRYLSPKRYDTGPLRNTNTESQVADRSVSVPLNLSDLKRRRVKVQNFLTDLRNYARTV